MRSSSDSDIAHLAYAPVPPPVTTATSPSTLKRLCVSERVLDHTLGVQKELLLQVAIGIGEFCAGESRGERMYEVVGGAVGDAGLVLCMAAATGIKVGARLRSYARIIFS